MIHGDPITPAARRIGDLALALGGLVAFTGATQLEILPVAAGCLTAAAGALLLHFFGGFR